PGAGLPLRGQAVIEVAPQAQIQGPISLGDVISHVQSKLLHVRVAVEGKQTTASRQIEGWQNSARIGSGIPVRAAEGDRKQCGVYDAESVLLIEERLLIDCPEFQV